jgi:predicted nucleic acid-binding protein
MALIVADASVVVAWLFPTREPDATAACAGELWERIRTGALLLRQPPHWLAETAAVVARLSPATAREDVRDLAALEVPVLDTPEVYLSACSLATELDHHLFDTLYHAVALELDGATLVTADERYYRRARDRGRIARLTEYVGP